jgi:hypothetical protein
VALHRCEQCPAGVRDIILDGSQVGLQIHESIGHPIELDRVLGTEANFAGMSFLTVDKLGRLKYASNIVNVVADATPAHGPGLGTFAYDDEGVPGQCTPIIKDGLFVGYLTSRETASAVGQPRSSGAMRAESWNRIPLIRMTNVSLLPGAWKLEDLIADTQDGIYMETNRSWSIDDRRYNFQFGPRSAGKSGAARKRACSRIPATAASPRSSGTPAMLFARVTTGRFGEHPTAAKASPCRPWARDMALLPRAFAKCGWAWRTQGRKSESVSH